MKSTSKNIRDLDSLEQEINRLKSKAKAIEQEWDENFEYLQANYRSMVRNSFFNSRTEDQPSRGSIVESFINNEKIQRSMDRIIDHFAGKVSGWMDSLTDWFIKKDRG